MNKDELLQELSTKLSTGEINRQEILSRLGPSLEVNEDIGLESKNTRFSVTKMLYVLGAAIVIIGIVIFVGQIWDDIGSMGRIFVTLGMGLLIAAIGSMLYINKPESGLGTIFHFMGGILIPGGAAVTISELSLDNNDWTIAITFGVIFAFYLLLNYIHKNAILTFFAIANGTAMIYLILNAVIGGPFENWFDIKKIYQYTTMALGLSYLLLGYAFREGWNKNLIGALYFFGITGFLGAAFTQVFDSGLWQMFYFLFVIGGLSLSVYMKSREILVMSTIFLIAHVSYITSEYFADSLGWPIVLIILGFVFIILGYLSVEISRKYIQNITPTQ
ncbi:MAG: hypothetical protein Q8L47_01125 [bacterium]|nr:hypothetical protein [bacterium]